MNVLKKTILLAMPAIMTGCGQQRVRYVITDKADNAIVYNQVMPVVDTTHHVMVFDQEPMDLYKYLSVGDTIGGYDNMAELVADSHWRGRWDRYYTISTVNGEYTSRFIQRNEEIHKRDSIIHKMNAARGQR